MRTYASVTSSRFGLSLPWSAPAVALALASLAWGGCADGSDDDGASQDSEGDDDDDDDHDQGDDDDDQGDDDDDDDDATARPNWHEDIAPVVAVNCSGCHHDEGIAFSMETFEQAAPYAQVMALQTEAGNMPPWHALETDDCSPPLGFENDPRLDDDTIQLFRDWADAGAPEGAADLAADLPQMPSLDLPDPSSTSSMGGSLTVEAEGSTLDFFHCLSFDPGNDEDVYVDGLQVLPGNSAIVHHVLIYVDEGAQSSAWPDGVSEDCGGGSGVGGATLVGAWIPGALPIQTPDGVGIRLPADSRIVFNVHYHANVTQPEVDDATGLALRWTDERPEWVSEFRIIGNPGSGASQSGDFMIPAGATDHEEVIEWPVTGEFGDLKAWAVINHMHKVGVDMRSSVVRSGGADECLVQTPDWDFNWQRIYEYDADIEDMPTLSAGDTLRMRCVYDNTLDNPNVLQALGEVGLDEPQDVYNGDGTLDEMCVLGIGLAARID